MHRVGALVVVVVALALGCAHAPARPAPAVRAPEAKVTTHASPHLSVGERVVFPSPQGFGMVNYCRDVVLGPAPAPAPDEAEVDAAEMELELGLRELGWALTDYHRQYTAIDAGGRRLVYVSAAATSEEEFVNDWATRPLGVCDGGELFFQGAFDPVRHTFVAFEWGALRRDHALDAVRAACGRILRRPEDQCEPATSAREPLWRRAFDLAIGRLEGGTTGSRLMGDTTTGWTRIDTAERVLLAAYILGFLRELDHEAALLEHFLATWAAPERFVAARAAGPKWLHFWQEQTNAAYLMLETAHMARLDHRAAAAVAERAARDTDLDDDSRKESLKNALLLFAALGDRAGLDRVHALLLPLVPSPVERAKLEALQKARATDVAEPYAAPRTQP